MAQNIYVMRGALPRVMLLVDVIRFLRIAIMQQKRLRVVEQVAVAGAEDCNFILLPAVAVTNRFEVLHGRFVLLFCVCEPDAEDTRICVCFDFQIDKRPPLCLWIVLAECFSFTPSHCAIGAVASKSWCYNHAFFVCLTAQKITEFCLLANFGFKPLCVYF